MRVTSGLESGARVLVIEAARGAAGMASLVALAQSLGDVVVDRVACLADAEVSLKRSRADCVLLDLELPDAGGVGSVSRLRELDDELVIVVVAGRDDEEAAMEALTLGAHDYLVKSRADGALLIRAVRYALERSRSAERVREAKQRSRLAFDAAPIGVAMTTIDGRFMQVNRALCSITGLTEQELLTKTLTDLTDREATDGASDGLGRLVAGEIDTYECEVRYRRADESTRWGSLSVSLARGRGLAPPFLIYHLADATDRVRARQALRESEETNRAIVEHAHDAFIAIDAGGLITAWNPAAERIFGWTRAEILGRALAETVIPNDLRAAHVAGIRRLQGGADSSMLNRPLELRALHRDGRELRVAITISKIRSRGPYTFHALVRDVTEERAMQDALRASEERFRLAVDNAPIGIALIALDGAFVQVNRALCEMTGYTERELLTKAFQDVGQPDDRDAHLQHVRQLLAGDIRTYETEQRCSRADGSTLWILLSASLVRDHDGAPVHYVAQMQDISERKRNESALRFMADHDVLTGLLNRRQLDRECERLFANQRRYGGAFSLILIDLDHFKYVNDTLGHHTGDTVIRAVADALRERMRETDYVVRLGGDEFAVLMPETDADAARSVATELLNAIQSLVVLRADSELRVTASIGIASSPADGDDHDTESLLAAADLAMYQAKDAGRNRLAIHRPAEAAQSRAGERLNWWQRICRALEHDGFVVHYQPIVSLADGSTRHHEALVRLKSEESDELIQPSTFLYIADRYGLMPAIDRWVIERVIEDIGEHTLADSGKICVNLSARSLTDATLLEIVARGLSSHGIAADRLVFELTETAAITKVEDARRIARELRQLGCEIALDDFGTGHGSFFHLKHLPYDYIKIDGEFIRGLNGNHSDSLIVASLVELASGLGKRTVAEYVASEQLAETLGSMGVDYAQGFYIGRPAPLAHSIPSRSSA